MSILNKSINYIVDLIFPKNCLNCGKENFWLCPDCFLKIKTFDNFQCPVCQKRLPNGEICESCRKKTKLSRFFAATSYKDPIIKNAIHKLKYNFIKDLTGPLSLLIIDFLKNINFDSNFLIVPVPLSKKRERWRGFNQSKEISKEVSKAIKVPFLFDELVKIKNTQPQVEIENHQERKENISGAFKIKNPEKFSRKKIILIDDVYTTGSTMEECAKVLKSARAKEIWGVVIAR